MDINLEQTYRNSPVYEEGGLRTTRRRNRSWISGRDKSFFCFTASETVLKSTLRSLEAREIMTRIPMMTLQRIHLTPGIHWIVP